MNTDTQSDAENGDAANRPEKYEDLVWVQCKERRCLAYIDRRGKWINFYTGKAVTDFVKVIY